MPGSVVSTRSNRAAAAGLPIRTLSTFEAPYRLESAPPAPSDYVEHLQELSDADRPGDMFAYFLTASDNGSVNVSGGRTNFAWFQGAGSGNFGNAVIGNPSFPVSGTSLEARENSTVTLNGTQIVEEMRATNSARTPAVAASLSAVAKVRAVAAL